MLCLQCSRHRKTAFCGTVNVFGALAVPDSPLARLTTAFQPVITSPKHFMLTLQRPQATTSRIESSL